MDAILYQLYWKWQKFIVLCLITIIWLLMIRLLENRKHIFRLTLHFDLIASSLNVVINHERSIMSESWRHQNVWGIKLISLHCY